MAASPARQGEVLFEAECRCGPVLVRQHSFVEQCERCHAAVSIVATVTLGPGGSVPHPDTWTPA